MKIILIADAFPPMKTSAAVQLGDLSKELHRQGHEITVILPSFNQIPLWSLESFYGCKIIRFKTPNIKLHRYFGRALAEFLMPFSMTYAFLKSPFRKQKCDGIIWYSPSIFHTPFIHFLKLRNKCFTYLIIRDIFPQWAYDLELLKKGIIFYVLKTIAHYQFIIADKIAVQSEGNKQYFKGKILNKVCVLKNWLDFCSPKKCSIQISGTSLAGRTIFVYAGNMGVAQGVSKFIELASLLKSRPDIGFLFVGRGSEFDNLLAIVSLEELNNCLFFDEIDSDEIPALFEQCDVGLVSLDLRHKSHNIPGKFLSYMQSGIPVLAILNPNNDLSKIIESNNVGYVCSQNSIEELFEIFTKLEKDLVTDLTISERCRNVFEANFTVKNSVSQILEYFYNSHDENIRRSIF